MAELYDPGQVVNGFRIVELINSGAQALSFAAHSPAGEKVFLKEYTSPSIRVPWYRAFVSHQDEMKRRIETSPCRQFCYRFMGGFEHQRCYHQVFEFLDQSHSLAQILDKVRRNPSAVGWGQRELMAKVLVAGIAQLHAARIVHADLKPENVMLITDHSIGMKYRLKLIDMDLSVFTDKRAPWHGHEGYFGTPGYFSPEHLAGKVPEPPSDVFTLGLMLYQLIARGHPYLFDEIEKYKPAYLGHRAARPRLLGTPQPPAHAADIENALHQCLHPDPSRRPTARELHRALTGDTSGASAIPLPPPMPLPPPLPPPRRGRGPAPIMDALPLAESPPPPPRASGRLMLLGPDGTKLTVGARVVLGRTVLARFGPNSQYAAEHQFVLDKTEDGWFVEPVPGTPNDTMFNGTLLAGRTELTDGDKVGVGRAASKRTVFELIVAFNPDGT